MRMAIFGSRTLIGDAVQETIMNGIAARRCTMLVTAGEPDGVCAEARAVAKKLSIPLTLHWLQPKERAAGKYHHRSAAVLRDCELCLFIHDGKSRGTKNEIALAKKLKVPSDIIVMKPNVESSKLMAAIAMIQGD